MAKLGRIIKDCRGQALVELVLILPIFLLLVFGIIEYGRIFSAQFVISNAARSGARIAAVTNLPDATLQQTVIDMCYMPDKTNINPQIKYFKANGDPAQDNKRTPGGSVQVEVSYPVTMYVPIISTITGNPHTVKADATMRVE